MSCVPQRVCGDETPALGLVPPPPGERVLHRRYGEFWAFFEDVVAFVEQLEVGGEQLGSRWDVEGDPVGSQLVRLWAAVAESVAAQTELTAGEAYLPTARDWTDLRRLAALVGYRPRPRIAAQGWVVADVETGADPLVPAGTRVQAPATAGRDVQSFETIADAQLRSDWAGLTATWVPEPAVPTERELRFLGSPGFRAGDQLLFVLEQPAQSPPPPGSGWSFYWLWILYLLFNPPSGATGLSLATVTGSTEELGTSLVSFDRDLEGVLDSLTAPYAAYRVLATAAPAKRLEKVLRIPAAGTAIDELALDGAAAIDTVTGGSVILDAALESLSAGQLVAVVDWSTKKCDIAHVADHEPVAWETAPGTPRRVSKLSFSPGLATLQSTGGEKSIYVLDRRVVARHYAFPAARPPGQPQVRLHPRPGAVPTQVAIASGPPDVQQWTVYGCREAINQEQSTAAGDAPNGLIVDLVDDAPADGPLLAPASGNVVRVRHGASASATLGSGDAAAAGQRMTTPDAPVTYDLDDTGNTVPSLVLRVEGVRWDEVPSLYGAGPAQVFAVQLEADGAVTAEFGDGDQGARLPTGRGNVAAAYRLGGGTAGEVESGAIDTLVGSVRGVKRIRGAGPTAGGADQDSELRLRRLVPTRARAFGRAVSIEDLVDLAVSYPGTSHAAAWTGAGPPGCACGGSGLHLAFVRESSSGPRPPVSQEIRSLSSYLDGRRDEAVALCVCAGVVTRPTVTAVLAVDPRRDAAAVAQVAVSAVVENDGPLAPANRDLGQPLDRSDVLAVLHAVAGVIGVVSLGVQGAAGELGRLGAARWELVYPSEQAAITGQPA